MKIYTTSKQLNTVNLNTVTLIEKHTTAAPPSKRQRERSKARETERGDGKGGEDRERARASQRERERERYLKSGGRRTEREGFTCKDIGVDSV